MESVTTQDSLTPTAPRAGEAFRGRIPFSQKVSRGEGMRANPQNSGSHLGPSP
jgi:hypothetical protein